MKRHCRHDMARSILYLFSLILCHFAFQSFALCHWTLSNNYPESVLNIADPRPLSMPQTLYFWAENTPCSDVIAKSLTLYISDTAYYANPITLSMKQAGHITTSFLFPSAYPTSLTYGDTVWFSYELTSYPISSPDLSEAYMTSGLYSVTVPSQTVFSTKASPVGMTPGASASATIPYGFNATDCCSDGSCCYPGYMCTPHGYSFCCPVNTTLCTFGIGSCCNADEVCLQDSTGNGTCWRTDSELDLDLNEPISMPTIYVGGGILNCGPHFNPDQCEAFYRAPSGYVQGYDITRYATVSDSESVLLVASATATKVYSTTTELTVIAGTTLILTIESLYKPEYATITSTYFHTGTFPSLVPTMVTNSLGPATYSTTTRNFTETAYSPSIITPTFTPKTSDRRKKRTYDYDRCGGPPDQDLQTNSLTEVCHFVANLEVGNRFVSLKPTTAAYMPSWIGYLVRVLTALASLTSVSGNLKDISQEKKKFGIKKTLQTAACIVGILETVIAIITISEHGHSWETIPFIDPLLWLSWLTMANVTGSISTYLAGFSYTIAIALYVVCLWLCIGYGCKGYGTEQYEIINIPSICQAVNVSWQTDPRRKFFVRLQCVILAAASLGVFIPFFMQTLNVSDISFRFRLPDLRRYTKHFSPSPVSNDPQTFGIPETESTARSNNQSNADRRTFTIQITGATIQQFVGACIIIPAVVATILAGVLNNGDYLILGQNGCYANYVSSKTGYIEQEFVEWKTKLGVWIGLLT